MAVFLDLVTHVLNIYSYTSTFILFIFLLSFEIYSIMYIYEARLIAACLEVLEDINRKERNEAC